MHWKATAEHPFGQNAFRCGIGKIYAGYAISTMKEMGLLEVSAPNRYMKFRTTMMSFNKDALIKMIIQKHKIETTEYRGSKKYDLTPAHQYVSKDVSSVVNTTIFKNSQFHQLESKVYLLKGGTIIEGVVIGIVPRNGTCI